MSVRGNLSKLMVEQRDCQPLLEILKRTTSQSEQLTALSQLFDLCHMSESRFRRYQLAICELGGVEVMVRVSHDNQQEDLLSWVFNVLGQLGFNNEATSTHIGSSALLLPLVLRVVEDPFANQKLKKHAIYSLTNVVANAWSTHQQLLKLLPWLVGFLNSSSTTKEVKSQCILTLGNFAYNPDSRPILIEVGAHSSLISALCCNDPDLIPTSSSIAIANLLSTLPPSSRELTSEVSHLMCTHIVNALKLTLKGHDCPIGSGVFYTDWKLANAIVNLAQQSPQSRTTLIEFGVLSCLEQCLHASTRKPDSGRLVANALNALWILAGSVSC